MTGEQTQDIGTIVARARTGDKDAFGLLVRRFENAACAGNSNNRSQARIRG